MKQFKTESKKLLDLVINSIYTNREIFLRELISNASDAIDKLWFKNLTNENVSVDRSGLAIRVAFDKDARTITVSDNGIGMTQEELDKNLGTIAHSGSEAFKTANAEQQGSAVDIIGQFGVGFYSTFMVGSKVRVVSRAFGSEKAYAWESDGVSGYTVSEAAPGELDADGEHGTRVTVTLRPSQAGAAASSAAASSAAASAGAAMAESQDSDNDTESLLSEWRLKELIRTYSNYVRYPIQMLVTKRRQKAAADQDTAAGQDGQDGSAGGAASDVAPQNSAPEWEEYQELETVNSMKPIWQKRASEVSQADYNGFYKSAFHDFNDPARTFTLHAEGVVTYDALLFIPGSVPFDMYSADFEKGLALYSSNVLIQDKCADLLPDYFGFVRGIVDSPDITLNISRETLQKNSQLKAIGRHVGKKVRSELAKMMKEDRDAYGTFFNNFGRALKVGIYTSYGAKAAELADLLLFWSAREGRLISLSEYAQAMPEGQESIYYAAGDARTRLAKMPVVESALEHGHDVLLCTADVDEFMFQVMHSYHFEPPATDSAEPAETADTASSDGESSPQGSVSAAATAGPRDLAFSNVQSSGLDFATKEEKERAEAAGEKSKDVLDAVASALGDKVARVRAAADLGSSPARIASEGPVSLEMERVLSFNMGEEQTPRAQRVLELNIDHPVFEKLAAAQKDGHTSTLELYAGLLYDQALLVAGVPVEDPVAFAQNICKLM